LSSQPASINNPNVFQLVDLHDPLPAVILPPPPFSSDEAPADELPPQIYFSDVLVPVNTIASVPEPGIETAPPPYEQDPSL
jgi:hypothetical protein